MPPLDACTYMGLDSGAMPIQISLFFDLLLPMCSDVTEEAFVSGSRSGPYGRRDGAAGDDASNTSTIQQARALLWKHLHSVKLKVGKSLVITPGRAILYIYLTLQALDYKNCLRVFDLGFLVLCENGIHSYMDNRASTHSGHLLRSPIRSLPAYVNTSRAHAFVDVSFYMTPKFCWVEM